MGRGGRGHHHRARTHRNPQAPKWTQKRDDDIALIGVAQLGKHPGLRRAVELVRGVPVRINTASARASDGHPQQQQQQQRRRRRRRRRRASQCRPSASVPASPASMLQQQLSISPRCADHRGVCATSWIVARDRWTDRYEFILSCRCRCRAAAPPRLRSTRWPSICAMGRRRWRSLGR
eukprot:COSAG01_NODE_1356_length_10592_cov_4.971995_9_plen_178_part_00